jgi:hypothetical protein
MLVALENWYEKTTCILRAFVDERFSSFFRLENTLGLVSGLIHSKASVLDALACDLQEAAGQIMAVSTCLPCVRLALTSCESFVCIPPWYRRFLCQCGDGRSRASSCAYCTRKGESTFCFGHLAGADSGVSIMHVNCP